MKKIIIGSLITAALYLCAQGSTLLSTVAISDVLSSLSPKSIYVLKSLMPWMIFIGFIGFAWKMVSWARKRKSGAYAFGALVQMVLPDPYVERTIKLVQEEKQYKKQRETDDAPKD